MQFISHPRQQLQAGYVALLCLSVVLCYFNNVRMNPHVLYVNGICNMDVVWCETALVFHHHTHTHTHMQIASGLGYLHMQQIVHRDMKSGNVLVWHFPSGRLSREKRVEIAGHVWLKLADYGTSEVFTKPMMKLSASPVGTPGYMAPELFGNVGQEISTEKVCTNKRILHNIYPSMVAAVSHQGLIQGGAQGGKCPPKDFSCPPPPQAYDTINNLSPALPNLPPPSLYNY